jgi:hypothetical protein
VGIEERRQERIIDGYTYSVVPLPTAAGLQALDRFKNVAAPLIAGFLSSETTGLEGAAAAAMEMLPKAISYADVAYFQKVFGDTSVYIDGEKKVPLTVGNQEIHFSGRYMALFDWLAFCMEVNFRGFFDDAKQRGSAAMSKVKEKGNHSTSSLMSGLSAGS